MWIADYVLVTYGTGAIMAVPAHDQRDFEFARRFGLEVRPVVAGEDGTVPEADAMEAAVPARGAMVDSGELTGTPAEEAFDRVCAWLEERGAGERTVNYRLRDWLISRQRYWGAPIPIVHCPECGPVAVPEDQLPVTLPDDVEWRPTGESPLKLHPTWKDVECPRCGGPGERDTDTMDTFMDSSWYHLRYLSPHYDEGPVRPGGVPLLDAGRHLHRRHRARHHAPHLHPLLPQGVPRPRRGAGRRADAASCATRG